MYDDRVNTLDVSLLSFNYTSEVHECYYVNFTVKWLCISPSLSDVYIAINYVIAIRVDIAIVALWMQFSHNNN